VGCGASKPSAPPYDDLDSDLLSDEEGQEDALAHWPLGTMHLGSLHRPGDFPLLLRVPCRLPCRQLIVKDRIQLVLNFTLGLRDWTLTTVACNRDFMKDST
jgi:hypothetical protein